MSTPQPGEVAEPAHWADIARAVAVAADGWAHATPVPAEAWEGRGFVTLPGGAALARENRRQAVEGGWKAREDTTMSTDGTNSAAAPQGDLRLLDSDVARRLLSSTIPARMAYIATDGTPRVIATWFHWTGEELVMPTFVSAPHIRRPAARLGALRAHPEVAITIDTETFPPMVLSVRGRVSLAEVAGVPAEYRLAARRYLGEEAAAAYLAQIDQPVTTMVRIAVRPTWVGVLDFQQRLPEVMGGPAS